MASNDINSINGKFAKDLDGIGIMELYNHVEKYNNDQEKANGHGKSLPILNGQKNLKKFDGITPLVNEAHHLSLNCRRSMNDDVTKRAVDDLSNRPLKIAHIAPLFESVPPKFYGGTERVVHFLVDELVKLGHDVTLFASEESNTKAKLETIGQLAIRLNHLNLRDPMIPHYVLLEKVRKMADQFDILHYHTDYYQFHSIQSFMDKTVTTLHGELGLPELVPLYEMFDKIPLITISNDQRTHLKPNPNFVATVHHGLPHDLLPFNGEFRSPGKDFGYLAFVGRITPDKAPDVAIEIASAAKIPLKIAAKVDSMKEEDLCFYREKFKPELEQHLEVAEFIGEINETTKADFLGKALALLFPIDWPEPFGLVMIEAMSVGTPVIARRRGSVPEVIEHGVSGFMYETFDEAVDAVRRVANGELSRANVRKAFEKRFTAERMAKEYVEIYKKQIIKAQK